MSEEIGINIELYHSNIKKLNASISDITSDLNKFQAFDKTNISPFKDDLENMIQAIQLLEKYKAILKQDVNTLRETGDAIRKKDEELAASTYQV